MSTAGSRFRNRPVFPDSDGKPVADNTLQFEWLSTIKWNLEHLFENDPDVFVAGDNLIYPDETNADVRQAPDVYVAFGRPKGYRGSYKVWEEGGIFPQVIFEIWSPGNTVKEMTEKREFYEKYGAEEFYLIFPEFPITVQAWWREGGALVRTRETNGIASPRLGIHIHFLPRILTITGPDGRPFRNPLQIAVDRDAAERQAAEEARQREVERRRAEGEAAKAEAERQRAEAQQRLADTERQRAEAEAAKAETERERAEAERLRAEAEKQRAEAEKQRAEAEKQRADTERERAERLAARLRELGLDPDAG